ncbi:putative repeat protein (TIGR01451 family) [Curtobacterium sp. PhB42]|nr:putative repeat protein (TIGR01451 family) [Curtobacterium sp. PhB191]TDW48390.1 putative repeat protein (TIGR01451 family) [Curtobacterium sp. PhB42]TDW53769.1 putative repeat protein (TIGR01451 family) [Curtobacterium sp. PhB190]
MARRLAAACTALTALAVLAAPTILPTGSSAATLDFPYVNQFSSASGGALHGDAAVSGGRLRLTADVRNQAGAWSTNDTFPSDTGLEIEFTYAMHTAKDDPGADGLLLYLADGAAAQGVGSFGAGLGYACRKEATEGGGRLCDLPGVPGGFAGIAIDHYGNFSSRINASGPGAQQDHVVVRGSGNGLEGYRYVAGAPAPGGTVTNGSTPRTVRITLLPGDAGELSMTVRLQVGSTMRTVLDAVPLHGDDQAPLPSTLRLGFAGATGSHVNNHEVDALRVWKPADLSVEHDLPATAVAGEPVRYTVTARNPGPNAADPSPLQVDVPDAIEGASWTCEAAEGSGCATPSGQGDVATDLDLPRGGSAVVTVEGRIADGVEGPLESVATIAPPTSLSDTNESDNTSRASTTVTTPPVVAHVETDKTVSPSTVEPGDEVEYTVTARNRGPSVAQQVGAVDDLPEAMRFVGSDDGCTAEGQRVTCRSDVALAVGETHDFRLRAVLDPEYQGDGSDVVNVATATSPTDPDGGDPSTEVAIVVEQDDDGPAPSPSPSPSPAPGPDDDDEASVPDAPRGDDGNDDGDRDPRGPVADAGPQVARGALAYTGVDDLGLLAALAAVVVAAGSTCWWLARRRARRSVVTDDQPRS